MSEPSDPTVDPTSVDPSEAEPQVAADPAERERESQRADQTRFDRERELEEAKRHAVAERLKAVPLPDAADEK